MKIKISFVALFAFIFVSSASFSQYKYDIGLRASSYDLERFNLDFRYHFDSPYSLVFSVSNGNIGTGQYVQTPIYDDSLVVVRNSFQDYSNTVFKAGVQRKLGFLASDVFYAGATVGVGFQKQQFSNDYSTYVVQIDSSGNVLSPITHPWEYQSTEYSEYGFQGINAQLGLSFGMDVPLTKRFSINAELGFLSIYQKLINTPSSIITLQMTASGGVRYSFGRRHKGTPGSPN